MSKHLKSVLILAIGLGLAWWFVSGLDWNTVSVHLRDVRIWPLLLAALLVNLTMLARSFRWQAFLSPITPAKFSNLFAATAVGFGAIFVIGRAGEVIRPAVLSLRERIKPTATFATILIERLFDTTAVVSFFAVNMLFFELPSDQGNADALGAIRSIGLTLLIGVVAGIFILALLRLKAPAIIGWMERHGARFPKKLYSPLLNFIRYLADGLSVLVNLRALATTVFFTVCVWALVCAATWLTLFAFRINFSVSHVIFIMGFGLVGSIVPTPGGSAGAFHAAAAKGMEFLGLDANLAASIAIVYHLIAFGPPFIVGLFYLIRDDISLRQMREMLASETAERQSEGETEGKRDGGTEGQSAGGKKRSYSRSVSLSLLLSVSLSLLLLKATGGVIL